MEQRKKFFLSFVSIIACSIMASMLFVEQKEADFIDDEEQAYSPDSASDDTVLFLEQDDIKITLPIHSIPIYEQYLYGQSDRNLEIQRTSYDFLNFHHSDESIFILLKYGCGTKLCSTLLIKMTNEQVTSMALSEGSIFIEVKQSPSGKSAAFLYGQNEGNLVIRNNLIPVDLEKMIIRTAENIELANIYMDNAIWPITGFTWVKDDALKVKRPDISNSDYDSLFTWYEGAMKTTEVQLNFQANEE